MADELVVSGPDAVSVTTSALLDQSARFWLLSAELDDYRGRLVSLDRVIGDGILGAVDAPRSAVLAEAAIDTALGALLRASDDCRRLGFGLRNAAGGYEFADRFAARMGQEIAAGLGYLAGVAVPHLLAMAMPGLLVMGGIGAAVFASLSPEGRSRLGSTLGGWLRDNNAALNDPGFVEAVRYSVMAADDAGAGLGRVPPIVARVVGDEGLGFVGVDTSAAVVAGAAGALGLARESPVTVAPRSSVTGVPEAGGVRDRAERIPDEPDQIRIDRISARGGPDRFEVYIAGTAELSISGDDEPWDMTSNLVAMGGGSAGSYRAVEEAMRLAGIDSASPVTLTGYSQGGLIAAQLAASGDYAVTGLVTLGAPAGQVAVPHDIPYLALEHSNDLVPALGGTFASSEPVVVRRQLFDGPPPPSDFVLPAHRLSNYLETAALIDQSSDPRIEATLRRLQHPAHGTVTSTVYLAQRVSGS
ncbi:MAG TPA: hypothetical protein VFS93_08790 [Terrimesophilobacter sp.]|nr:hypothetical protein [Terrimesophilobacter sp.]